MRKSTGVAHVFHTTEKDRSSLTETIEDTLQGALGYEVPTFLRTPEELQEVIERAPFAEVEKSDDLRSCVVFAAEALGPGPRGQSPRTSSTPPMRPAGSCSPAWSTR